MNGCLPAAVLAILDAAIGKSVIPRRPSPLRPAYPTLLRLYLPVH